MTTHTPTDEDWLTAEQISQRLGVCSATIRLWGRQKRIPVLRLGYRTVRYDIVAVKKALSKKAKVG